MASLRAAARSAYRDLYRASTTTFSGDPIVLNAFRQKMRQDALAPQDEAALEEHIKITRDIATILRQNVVQAQKDDSEEGIWKIRMTKHTELGDNDSIKEAKVKLPPSRRQRLQQEKQQKCSDASTASPDPAPDSPIRTLNYSALKKISKHRTIPTLDENDLEERFVRGSGPGGQSVNKTENNVQLLHKPTGIRVTCQETRSLQTNRMLARRKLVEKLDELQNPGLSKSEVARAKQRERERQKRKKAKKKEKKRQAEMNTLDNEDPN